MTRQERARFHLIHGIELIIMGFFFLLHGIWESKLTNYTYLKSRVLCFLQNKQRVVR